MEHPRGSATLALIVVTLGSCGCGYVKLLRPKALKQLSPEMVALVNELPEVDDPNTRPSWRGCSRTAALGHADLGGDGVFRQAIAVPRDEYTHTSRRKYPITQQSVAFDDMDRTQRGTAPDVAGGLDAARIVRARSEPHNRLT